MLLAEKNNLKVLHGPTQSLKYQEESKNNYVDIFWFLLEEGL